MKKIHDNICCQQLEEIRQNVLRLTLSKTKSDRRIISPKIPNKANGKQLSWVGKNKSLTAWLEK